ncbi:MAG: hypothetical protein WBG95_08805 [Sulfitobacter sp.]
MNGLDQRSLTMEMKSSRTFGVIGLDNFRITLAKEIQRFGNDVIRIDIFEARVADHDAGAGRREFHSRSVFPCDLGHQLLHKHHYKVHAFVETTSPVQKLYPMSRFDGFTCKLAVTSRTQSANL